MKPNITNLKKVTEGELKLEDIDIEISNRYMPTMQKAALISKVDKYIMELRLHSEGIAPPALPTIAESILFYHVISFYTNISTRTVDNNPDNHILKAMELADIAKEAGVLEYLKSEVQDVNELWGMLDILIENSTGLYGMIYHIILQQRESFDISEVQKYLTKENIEKITSIISTFGK